MNFLSTLQFELLHKRALSFEKVCFLNVYLKIILIKWLIPSTKSQNFVSSLYIRIGLGSKFSQLMSWAGDQTLNFEVWVI